MKHCCLTCIYSNNKVDPCICWNHYFPIIVKPFKKRCEDYIEVNFVDFSDIDFSEVEE